jgi:retron-type reverse transcriptase
LQASVALVYKVLALRSFTKLTPSISRPLRWKDLYRKAELYRAALRVYTKPLFHWRKALSTSTDGKTLYDFAVRGLRNLDALHASLQQQSFEFRPAVALHYNFNGKHRTLYIEPWEERIVDLLLYRLLNRQLHSWFSPNSYAYRNHSYGLDQCQARVAAELRCAQTPVYLVKRDVSDYFASINHEILLNQIRQFMDMPDYLFRLLRQRIEFLYEEDAELLRATVGVPFGTAIACLLANIYLTDLDRQIESIPQISYFRYADDILVLSTSRTAAELARERLETALAQHELKIKDSHRADLVLSDHCLADGPFAPADQFRHLGLMFRVGGDVALSRDKLRKIQNLFRFAFRRGRRRWKKPADARSRAQALIAIAKETIETGIRNVAVTDYYLKHVDDERQLRLLDRWLAEEILSAVFGGHKKSHFRRINFGDLRHMGLPSLLHRRRLICRGVIESPFFIWQRQKGVRAFRGTVARLHRPQAEAAFSSVPGSSSRQKPVREGGCL